jgi:hypothetical protein
VPKPVNQRPIMSAQRKSAAEAADELSDTTMFKSGLATRKIALARENVLGCSGRSGPRR